MTTTSGAMQEFLEFMKFKEAQGILNVSGNGEAVGAGNGGAALALVPRVGGAVASSGSLAGDAAEENNPDESLCGAPAVLDSPFDDLVLRDDLARLLRVSGKTVERMAEDHRLPPGVDIGRKVWSKQRAYAWIIARMEKAEDEALAEMARLKL